MGKRVRHRLLVWLSPLMAVLGLLAAGIAYKLNRQKTEAPLPARLHLQATRLARTLGHDLARMSVEADTLAARVQAKPRIRFTALMGVVTEPVYVFQDTNLVFWSHFDRVPPPSLIPGSNSRILRDEDGLALLYVKHFPVAGQPWHILVRKSLLNSYPVANAYLKAGWAGANLSGVSFGSDSIKPDMARLYGPEGRVIAGIEVPPSSRLVAEKVEVRVLALGALALLLSLTSIAMGVSLLASRKRYVWAILVWGLGMLAVKAGFALPAIRSGLDGLALFSPRLYASSTLAPSLGDLLITTLVAAAFTWIAFRYFFRTRWLRVAKGREFLTAAGVTVIHLTMLLAAYRVMRSLYLHSQAVLDVARGFRLGWERLAALAIFIAVSFTLFFGMHILARVLTRLARRHAGRVRAGIAVGALGVGAGLYLFESRAWPLEIAGVLFLLAWLRLRLPEYLFKLRYQTYFYLFSIAILAAGAATQAYSRYRDRQGLTDRQRFARRLVAQGDPLAEYLLWEAGQRLATDSTLRHMLSDSPNFEQAEEYLRRTYSDAYFDQYFLEIGVFGPDGRLRSGQAEADRMTAVQHFVGNSMVHTGYEGIFFSHMPSDEVFKRYITVIDVPASSDTTGLADPLRPAHRVGGYITLDLKMRRLAETSVFATLLVNGSGQDPSRGEKYSYAVYDSAGIVQQDGPFNYERGFSPVWLRQKAAIEILHRQGWIHTLFLQPDGQQVVVSTPDTHLRDAFTNFSFLLLVLVAFILVFVIGFTLRSQLGERRLTFAGKIQIYLNAAFFLPLTVFGLVSFSLVELSLRADLNAGYLLRARNAAKSIEPLMDQMRNGRLKPVAFSQKLDDMARFTGLNASLYSSQGRLIYSSHPLIYRKGILSTFINPEALTQLGDEGLHETLLEERLGRLPYSSAYVAVRVPKSRRIAAVLAVPFFEAGSELETQLSNAIATVVSSFTAVFIVFMVLSYFASQILVVPLKLITARLKRTTLGETEPLYWAAEDEIGMMVESYNGMLRKLEASRAALAATEKESAWREMAQQVAHEIKNPLTPMKLTIQQLQRVLAPDQPAPQLDTLQRPLAGMLQQIENLSDIAGSFSAFARMPQPKAELFDLARIVRRTAELHRSDSGTDITLDAPTNPREAVVLGDEGIFQGIVNNLILNGLQAVQADRRAHIRITLERLPDNLLRLCVTDNGEGIPEEVQGKVFIPNFSTKFSGSGIGLALARRGVEHAGGRIWFETVAGEGTTFFIELVEQGEATKI